MVCVMSGQNEAGRSPRKNPRQRLLARMPPWLRVRLDLHYTGINDLLLQAAQEVRPGQRLLDAGAGEGQYRAYFSHLRYSGVDLAVGDATWDYSGLDVVGDLARLPFGDAIFDAAICLEVLEHLPEPLLALQELHRILRPGGRLYFSVPMSWHQHQKPHDYYRFTSFGLRYLLDRAGFEVNQLRPTGGYFWFLSIQFQMLSVWIFPRQQSRLQRLMLMPLKCLVQAIFFILLPLMCYYLDRLDHEKDQTMAWTGVATCR
jgi:SAM-dependent methyltransferase